MGNKILNSVSIVISLFFFSSSFHVAGEDWPTWRYDASRSAASPEELPRDLYLRWVRKLPPAQAAWPHVGRLHFDASYELVAMGKKLFLGSPNDGSIEAFDTDTGEEVWKFYTEGPVRFAPVAWKNRVYVGSDDGYLYCLEATNGSLLWKFRGASEDRPDQRHLGNNRLISFWPVRGGPVLKDGLIYLVAGIWPTLGIFISALDAETGELVWMNEKLDYIENVRIDHNMLQDSGLSPQGYLVAVSDKLLVPNGRSMPAGLDAKTGELIYYCQGYRHGDCRVTANEEYAFVGDDGVVSMEDLREVGSKWAKAGSEAPEGFVIRKRDLFEGPFWKYKMFPGCNARSVLEAGICYGMENGVFYAYDLSQARATEYERESDGVIQRPLRWDAPELWNFHTGYSEAKSRALIKAGGRLYGHAGEVLFALEVSEGSGDQEMVWEKELDGTPSSMIAADNKLFVVTEEGGIYCFGSEPSEVRLYGSETKESQKSNDEWTRKAADILRYTGVTDGYCLILGLGTGRLLEEMLKQSDVKVIGVDADPAKVNRLRTELAASGVYGTRVELFIGSPSDFPFSPYIAELVISETYSGERFLNTFSSEQMFDILHPYGGLLCIEMSADLQSAFEQWAGAEKLAKARTKRVGEFALLVRPGALPGSAVWTHEASDAARSYYSEDELVKPPLGILWYGDGEDYGFYKIHDYGLGVKPQVVGGKVFALQQFSGMLYAYDAYTGRFVWKKQVHRALQQYPFIEDGSFDWKWVSTNKCVARYASMHDGIYVVYEDRCIVYDPETGRELNTFQYYRANEGSQIPIARDIRVSRDTVIIAASFTDDRRIEDGLWDSTMLVALDRKEGKVLWTKKAEERFNCKAFAASDDTVFCIDSISPLEVEKWMRRGKDLEAVSSTIMALDARTGEAKWTRVIESIHTTYGSGQWLPLREKDDWLAYSREQRLLIAGKQGKGYAFDAKTGRTVWAAKDIGSQPISLGGEDFINQSGRIFGITSGEINNDESLFHRGGCNYAVAGRYLAFLRDETACYVDLHNREKHYLRVIRSGCSASLIAADGLLNVPNFSAGCMCNYPIQTSFAMVYMPVR
ncbi:PQQ-binding-like beta-propeller repeat protein [Candidatus Poribacteria bacterium]